MKLALLLIILLSASAVSSQNKHTRVGEIEFYGYAGLDLNKIRAALPLREGDEFSDSEGSFSNTIDRISEAIERVIGKSPTDISVTCCDVQGNQMIYIGLPGNSMKLVPYNPQPIGSVRLPAEAMTLYQEIMEASFKASGDGAKEDASKGYPLSTDPALRAKQLAAREYAGQYEGLVRHVLASSQDVEQRATAAYILGYARQSKTQVAALTRAGRDADDSVRNNAIRALGVLARSGRLHVRVPAAGFIAMLSSESWTDRNKVGCLLETLTRRRDRKLLRELRWRALDSLIEMARWRNPSHAHCTRVLLGRIAGIEETRLQQIVKSGEVGQIIKMLR